MEETNSNKVKFQHAEDIQRKGHAPKQRGTRIFLQTISCVTILSCASHLYSKTTHSTYNGKKTNHLITDNYHMHVCISITYRSSLLCAFFVLLPN